MKIAGQLKEKNIAEYLIYMWQVEDMIRANGCDIDRVEQTIISRYPEEERPALREWYGNWILNRIIGSIVMLVSAVGLVYTLLGESIY